MYRYLHVGVNFGNLPYPVVVDNGIGYLVNDWIRYTPNNWIVWTNKTVSEFSHSLKGYLTLHDTFVVFELKPGPADGMTYQWVWDWLNASRDPQTGTRLSQLNVGLATRPSISSEM